MDCCSDNQTITIYKWFPTHFNNSPLINVSFDTHIDLTGFSAIFRIGETEKTYTDIAEGFSIDLTKEETGALPVGLNYGELIVVDNETHKRPFTTALPFNVLTFVEGDIHLDNYNVTVTTKINGVDLTINIETPTVEIDPEEIERYISEHNLDEEAHPYILGELDKKVDKVSTANRVYGTDENGYQTTYDANSFGQVDDVQVGGVSVVQNKIASLGTMAGESASDYRTANYQDTIDSGLSDRIGGVEDTIDTYGNIVTHNVSEFATSAQGALADSALQPSDVINNVSSTTTNKPLSANMGKELQDQIDNLKARGRFLALWNCATGLAESDPPTGTYTYQTGDYFIVGVVAQSGGTNYKPSGSSYTTGVASTAVETQPVDVGDVYYYDGTVWRLQVNTQKEISFVNIAGSPYDNTNLAGALNSKQNEITSQSKLSSDLVDDTNHTNKFVTAEEKTTWNNKQAAITGGATTITSSNLTASRALISNSSGKVAVSTTTSTELGYVHGVTSAIQTQLNGKQSKIGAGTANNIVAYSGTAGTLNTLTRTTSVRAKASASDTYIPTEKAVATSLEDKYDASNPAGYTSNVGTVTSVNNVQPVNGNVTLSIPTVNNPTITITQGGVTKGSFTLNQSSGDTIALDAGGGGLPSQSGHAGEFLTTDGTDTSWATVYAMQIIDYTGD